MRVFIHVTIALAFCLINFPVLAHEISQKKAGDLTIEPYTFETEDNQRVTAELGHLFVPENRNNPQSKIIELVFVRFKSNAKNPASPIVYVSGGSGSGIGAAKLKSRFPFFMAMREVGDVIVLDQRGVGLSKPSLSCRAAWNLPLDKPSRSEDMLRAFDERSRACADLLKGQGVDISAYNTNERADDLEDLRKALGAKKINLWGISQGTHTAFAAIRRHEAGIERVIMSGVEGVNQSIKLPSNVQKEMVLIDGLVKRDPKMSKRIPDFLALVKSVIDRLEKQPVTVEVTDPRDKQKHKVTVGKFDLQYWTASGLGDVRFIRILPARYYAMSKGDFSVLALQTGGFRISPIGAASNFVVDCASGASPERLARIRSEEKETLLGSVIDFFALPEACKSWGNPDLGAAFRAEVKSRVPVLFISGTLDGRTPPSNVEELIKGFPNSTHLIIEGSSHDGYLLAHPTSHDGVLLTSPKTMETMVEFMKGRTVSTTKITLSSLELEPLTSN